MSAPATKSYTNLEILRFLSALTIVVFHYYQFDDIGSQRQTYTWQQAPFAELLRPMLEYGQYGVQFFWMLSGFIFFSQYADRIRHRLVDGRTFAVLRFSRLYPLHITTAVLMFGLLPLYQVVLKTPDNYVGASHTVNDLVLHAFMASQWDAYRHLSLNAPVWSVSLEILAYISFFLALRYLPRLSVLLTVLAPVVLPFAILSGDPMGQCFAYFYTGGALFLLTRGIARLPRTASIALTGTVLALTGLVTVALPQEKLMTFLIPAWFALVILSAVLLPQPTGTAGRWASHAGNTTYASYLIHLPIQTVAMIGFALAGVAAPWREPWLMIVWVLVVFAASTVLYRKFEAPAQTRIRARLLGSRT